MLIFHAKSAVVDEVVETIFNIGKRCFEQFVSEVAARSLQTAQSKENSDVEK